MPTSVITNVRKIKSVITFLILIIISLSIVYPATSSAVPSTMDTSDYHAAPQPTSSNTPTSSAKHTTMGPSTSNQVDNKDFTTQAPLTGVSARQTNNIVGAQSYYDVLFTTSTTGTIKFIDIAFPAGILIGSAPLLVEREGIGAGTAVKTSATVIRYTVTSAVSVPAGTQIRLEFFNIVNPTAPSVGYKVTVITRTAGGTTIDGPTLSNSLNMKQINTVQIADGAITSTKPAESLMKRVTLIDDPAGHALGWDPGFGPEPPNMFTISEPAISSDIDNSFLIVEARDPDPGEFDNVCLVRDRDHLAKEFTIICNVAPDDGSELHYVVGNLPEHVICGPGFCRQ
jgi:hypothetical protein